VCEAIYRNAYTPAKAVLVRQIGLLLFFAVVFVFWRKNKTLI
jgi:hypothetical protein